MKTKMLLTFILCSIFQFELVCSGLGTGALMNLPPVVNGHIENMSNFGTSGISASKFLRSQSSPIGLFGCGTNSKVFQQSSVRTKYASPPKAISKGDGRHEEDDKIWHYPPYKPEADNLNLKAELTADLIYQDNLYHNVMASIMEAYQCRKQYLLDEIIDGKLSKAKADGIDPKIPSRLFYLVVLAESLVEYLFHEGHGHLFVYSPEMSTHNNDFVVAFNKAKEKFMNKRRDRDEDRKLKVFMIANGLYTQVEMNKFMGIYKEMYPPLKQNELEMVDKMKNAFEKYKVKNRKFFDGVRHVISQVILFWESETRKGMKDEQK